MLKVRHTHPCGPSIPYLASPSYTEESARPYPSQSCNRGNAGRGNHLSSEGETMPEGGRVAANGVGVRALTLIHTSGVNCV